MKIALFGQYYQNNTAEIVAKVVDFLSANNVSIYFEAGTTSLFVEVLPCTSSSFPDLRKS